MHRWPGRCRGDARLRRAIRRRNRHHAAADRRRGRDDRQADEDPSPHRPLRIGASTRRRGRHGLDVRGAARGGRCDGAVQLPRLGRDRGGRRSALRRLDRRHPDGTVLRGRRDFLWRGRQLMPRRRDPRRRCANLDELLGRDRVPLGPAGLGRGPAELLEAREQLLERRACPGVVGLRARAAAPEARRLRDADAVVGLRVEGRRAIALPAPDRARSPLEGGGNGGRIGELVTAGGQTVASPSRPAPQIGQSSPHVAERTETLIAAE